MDAAPFAPMEARLANALPDPPGWQYEPKWDGFRAIAERDGEEIEIWSKSGKPLGRYFPELLEALASIPEKRFILDGELVIPIGDEGPSCGSPIDATDQTAISHAAGVAARDRPPRLDVAVSDTGWAGSGCGSA